MRKFSKGLLAVLLVVTVAVSAFALTGVFSSAQAIPEDVSIAFSGTMDENDWVTLSGTTIKDTALTATIYNYSEDTIILDSLANNGTSITYTGWTTGNELTSGAQTPIKIAGTTTNNAVLTVTLTYHIKGYPTSTKETCTAYIYCSSSNAYKEYAASCGIESGLFRYGVDTTLTLYPENSASVEQRGSWTQEPTITATVYVDGSKYKTWADLNAKINFANGTIRDHAYWDQIKLTVPANCGGSFQLLGYGTNVGQTSYTSTYNKDAEGDDKGFFCQVGESANTDMTITGTIPTAASTTIKVELRGYGQTGGIMGLLSSKTRELSPIFNITVINNNKSALRERLTELSGYGLNKASYKSGWDAYETALKNAYTVLGSMTKTASEVSTALSNLNSKYNALVRYAVVFTNHYLYEGTNNENPVLKSTKIDMQVTNGSTYTVETLTSSSSVTFNRSNVTRTKLINVNGDNNYTEVINQYYWYVDTSGLQAAITEQGNKVHLDEEGNSLYTEDSWQAYVDAAAEGARVIGDTSLFQDDIDAAKKAITDARDALTRLDIDTEWLDEGIQWAGQIISNDYENDFDLGWDTEALFASDYSGELYTALETAYNNAVAVVENPEFTKSQADRACTALWEAINNLRVVDETTSGLFANGGIRHADIERYGYFKGLKDQLIDTNGLTVVYDNIINKTGSYNDLHEEYFTAESWEALQSALYGDFAQGSYACAETDAYPSFDGESELTVPAYSMINNIWFLASQADYNACRDNLIDKVNHLEWVVDADKIAALQDKYDEANALDLSLFTTASTQRLLGDIEYLAEKIEKLADPQLYGDPDAIKDELLDEYYTELVGAIAELQEKPSLSPIEEKDVDFEGDDEIVTGETVGTTVAEILQDFNVQNDSQQVEAVIVDANGQEVDANAALATGFEIVLRSTVDQEEFERHVIAVKGDLVGDAQMTDADVNIVVTFAFTDQGIAQDSAEFLAGDMNGDGVVDLSDAIMMDEMINA